MSFLISFPLPPKTIHTFRTTLITDNKAECALCQHVNINLAQPTILLQLCSLQQTRLRLSATPNSNTCNDDHDNDHDDSYNETFISTTHEIYYFISYPRNLHTFLKVRVWCHWKTWKRCLIWTQLNTVLLASSWRRPCCVLKLFKLSVWGNLPTYLLPVRNLL